ncbi:MAG: hypothetical protein ABI670_15375 [Chloroflexota bacterium]
MRNIVFFADDFGRISSKGVKLGNYRADVAEIESVSIQANWGGRFYLASILSGISISALVWIIYLLLEGVSDAPLAGVELNGLAVVFFVIPIGLYIAHENISWLPFMLAFLGSLIMGDMVILDKAPQVRSMIYTDIWAAIMALLAGTFLLIAVPSLVFTLADGKRPLFSLYLHDSYGKTAPIISYDETYLVSLKDAISMALGASKSRAPGSNEGRALVRRVAVKREA